MRALWFLCVFAMGWLACAPAMAATEPRLALVVVNGAYRHFDHLAGTYADGETIAAALTGTGFVDASGRGAVQVRKDLDSDALAGAIAAFRAALAAAGPKAFGVLYYSGHGAAHDSFGDVMMVPVDADQHLDGASAGFSRAAVTRTLLGSGARTVLLVLDMCRDVVAPAPALAGSTAQGSATPGTRGLGREGASLSLRPDQGYLTAFSTSPDQAAFDDGTFSKVLAEEIRRPAQSITDALKRVSDRVALAPGKSFQKPTFDYGLQGRQPCFVSCDVLAGGRFLDCASCPYMRIVPAGDFVFGSPASEPHRGADEPIQAPARMPQPFAMGIYEVTIAEWAACVRDRGCLPAATWSRDNPNPLIPVTGISYDDAQAYTKWLSKETGQPYRLPSEQEWEYADRAQTATIFPWGDAIAPSDANYDQTASYRHSATAPYRGYPEAVNAYPPNAFGLYQMQGNVWEWSSGCGDNACATRVLRGGSFESVPSELRAANRFAIPWGKRREDAGLRVVRALRPDEITD